MRCAAWLYPASWRRRYGDELDALMEDVGAGWADLLDLCKGAIQMQMMRGRVGIFVAACAVVGLLVAGASAVRMPSEYRSQAVLQTPAGDWDDTGDQLHKAEQRVLSRNSLTAVIQLYDLFKEERKSEPLEDIVQDMRNRDIQIRMLGVPGKPDANAFALSFNYSDPAKAKTVNEELTARMVAAMKDTAPLTVLDPPSLPARAYGPNRPVIVTAGLLIGIVTAFVLMGIRRWPLIPLAGLLVAVVVLPATYLIPDHYRSMAVLRVKADAPSETTMNVVRDRAFLQSLISDIGLYRKQPQDALTKMQQSLMVRKLNLPGGPPRRWSAFSVSFEYTDRYKAQKVVREMVAKMAATETAPLEVLDPASLPEQSFEPNRFFIVFLALVVGLLLGGVLLAVRQHRTPALA